MSVTVDPTKLLSGQPGVLYQAPLGSTLPANTVVGSVFTDVWPIAWVALGPTDAGTTVNHAVSTDNVEVEEQLAPVRVVTTGRASNISFALAHYTLTNYKAALNGGTITVTGSTTTTLNQYTPPTVGGEVRTMIGWQSDDSTIRFVGLQCFQSGSVAPQYRKGAQKALLACQFSFEMPSVGYDFIIWTAGTARG